MKTYYWTVQTKSGRHELSASSDISSGDAFGKAWAGLLKQHPGLVYVSHFEQAWSARCECYNNHHSSSGRCGVREVRDPTRRAGEIAVCESCRANCPLGSGLTNEGPDFQQLLREGFSYYNIRTQEALGGPDNSRQVTDDIRRIKDLIGKR